MLRDTFVILLTGKNEMWIALVERMNRKNIIWAVYGKRLISPYLLHFTQSWARFVSWLGKIIQGINPAWKVKNPENPKWDAKYQSLFYVP